VSTSQSNGPNTGNNPQFTHNDELHHAIFPSGRDFFAWLTIGIIGAILLFLSLTAGELFSPGVSTGDVAEKDILAGQNATIVDPIATSLAVEHVRQHVIPDFVIDRQNDQKTLDAMNQRFSGIKSLQDVGVGNDPQITAIGMGPREHVFVLTCSDSDYKTLFDDSGTTNEYIHLIRGRLESKPMVAKGRARAASAPSAADVLKRQREIFVQYKKDHPDVSKEQVYIAAAVRPAELLAFGDVVLGATNRVLQQYPRFPVKEKNEWQKVVIEFLPDQWNRDLRAEASALICDGLEPNLVIDPSATKTKADAAVRALMPVMKEIKQGDIVIKKGEVITEDRQDLLRVLSVKSVKSTALILVLGISLMAALGFSGLFLLTYEPKHFFSTTSIALMYTIGIVTSVATSLLGASYPEFVPIPAAALLLTIFFRRRVALALILPIIILLFVEGYLPGGHLLALSTAAISAILTYSKRRNSLVYTGFIVGVSQLLGFLCACGIAKALPFVFGERVTPYLVSWLPNMTPDFQMLGLQFAGGIASSIIAIGSLPFLENIFGLVTPYRLIELTDAEQPLLRQLEEKAPGTYQHSLAVANLAEAGAKAIHVDANLVRAGALYHDIGKMVKARFFIENQLGAANPHDSMTPEESRDRVLAHVTDGIELAHKFALPKAVEDFIPMHQGTTLMAYFYHKACQRDGVENVDANFFRYPGPKPNTKETAIVMLADVSEAVTHSMKDPTELEVDEAIDRVFENRWADGQFLDSTLTYDELQRVRLAFVRVWRTLHHDRLKYPSTTTGRMAVAPEVVTATASTPTALAVATLPKQEEKPHPVEHVEGPCDCVIAEFGPPDQPESIPAVVEQEQDSPAAKQ